MELRNTLDTEISFQNLNEAKNYYNILSEKEPQREEYLGDDFDKYVESWKEYRSELEQAGSLEELADVLNNYTDVFQNGSEWYVG